MSKLDLRDVIALVQARVKRVLDLVELVVRADKFAERTDAAERSAQADTVITVCRFDVSMARNQVAAMPQ